MERIRNIECGHDKYVKLKENLYICIKCNYKFTEKELQKIKKLK